MLAVLREVLPLQMFMFMRAWHACPLPEQKPVLCRYSKQVIETKCKTQLGTVGYTVGCLFPISCSMSEYRSEY